MYDGAIDWLVGAYGHNADTDARVTGFLRGLAGSCNLAGVSVTCAERQHHPASSELRSVVQALGFHIASCPLLPETNVREDTSVFTDWMVENIGSAPWVVVSHYDVVFIGDYVKHVRELMSDADMIGDHHDGIVLVRREAYRKCRVGFCGIDGMRIVDAGNDLRLVPVNFPGASGRSVLSLDVGELLSLRMCTLGLRHLWSRRGDDVGKSEYFRHTRRGSGHGGLPGDGDE